MNTIILSGRITDKELKVKKAGETNVLNFSIAVSRPYKKDKTDFFRVVVFGKTAEMVAKYFKKGDGILVEGSLQNKSYENKEGQTIKYDEVVANKVHFPLCKKHVTDNNTDSQGQEDINPDDVPF